MNDKASIIYSKINIKRNLENYNFVDLLTEDKKKKLEQEVIEYIDTWGEDIRLYDLNILNDNEKKIYLDENLIDDVFYKKADGKFIIFNKIKSSILLNNDDHININIVEDDLTLKNTFDLVDKIERRLSGYFSFSASVKYGYLTSYVKDCGLGMKVYVLAQLSGIKLLKKEKEIFKMYPERGYSIEPYYLIDGKESKIKDTDYYIISSRLNFGVSEKNLISRFTQGIENLLKLNKKFLLEYYYKNKDELVDIIFRSYGILKYATRIDYMEALEHITNIRIGLIIGENIPITNKMLNNIFVKIKDGYVTKQSKLFNIDKQTARANIIKKILE